MRRVSMLHNTLAISTALILAGSSQAAIIIVSSSSPTVGLPNYTTYTLTAQSTAGEQIVGFDFASLPTYGFVGAAFNQVNPAGQSTVFADANGFFPFVGADVSQDTQFKFHSANLTVPAGFASESSTTLRAVFASGTSLGTSVPFVQLTVANSPFYFAFTGTVTTSTNGVYGDVAVTGTTGFPPPPPAEPATLVLIGIASIGCVGYRRRK